MPFFSRRLTERYGKTDTKKQHSSGSVLISYSQRTENHMIGNLSNPNQLLNTKLFLKDIKILKILQPTSNNFLIFLLVKKSLLLPTKKKHQPG